MDFRRSVVLLGILSLIAVSLGAQQPEPISYVAAFKVNPGKEGDFINLAKKYDQPMFEKLMTEGTVLAWGVDTSVIHQEGAPTHMLWWAMPNYGAMDKVFAAFEEQEKKIKAEDEQRAAEARRRGRPAPRTVEQEFMETVDMQKHADRVLRSILINVKAVPAGTLPYTSISSTRLQPGKAQEWRQLWEKYNKPVFDKLVADGTIFGYGVDREDQHSSDPGWRWAWVLMPNLATTDKLIRAFEADRQARSPEERAAITRQFQEITVPDAHRDELFRAAIFAAAEASAGSE